MTRMLAATRFAPAALFSAALSLSAIPLAAQAICSAPHSSPTLTQSGAIRTMPTGAGWLQLSLYGQRSRDGFDPRGDRQPFLANATFNVRSVFATAALGVSEGLEVWVQAPVHLLTISGEGGSSRTTGLGDLRGAVRISPALLGVDLPFAVRGGIKLPGSDFPVLATELPISEGQLDFEVSIESGVASEELPVYLVAWVGHRWRTMNDEVQYDPGNESFGHLAAGGAVGAFSWEVGLDGLWGQPPFETGLTLPSASRRLLQLLPTIGTDVGPGRLEVTTPIPLAGRNLPAGVGISVGYRSVWGM